MKTSRWLLLHTSPLRFLPCFSKLMHIAKGVTQFPTIVSQEALSTGLPVPLTTTQRQDALPPSASHLTYPCLQPRTRLTLFVQALLAPAPYPGWGEWCGVATPPSSTESPTIMSRISLTVRAPTRLVTSSNSTNSRNVQVAFEQNPFWR